MANLKSYLSSRNLDQIKYGVSQLKFAFAFLQVIVGYMEIKKFP